MIRRRRNDASSRDSRRDGKSFRGDQKQIMQTNWLDQTVPIAPSETPLARHCSALGAQDALPRACRQTRSYLRLMAQRGDNGLTDWEAADLMGIERTSITARRRPLCTLAEPWVVTNETRPGPTGIKNTVWMLSKAGRAAVDAMTEAA